MAGTYELYVDIECDGFKCYNASVFRLNHTQINLILNQTFSRNPDNGIYLYRSKYGDWVFGKKWMKILHFCGNLFDLK